MKTTNEKIIINTRRDGYNTDQIDETMTVGELIEFLSDFDENIPVYFGNDRRSYGWYTYGAIYQHDIELILEDEEE